jgi:uncharacterized RDD family membrane protein YckC
MWAMAFVVDAPTAPASLRVRVVGFWRRTAAAVVDGMILAVVFGVLDILIALILRHPLPRLAQIGPDYLVDAAFNGGALAEAGLFLAAILGFLYFFIFHTLRGQTPGKRLMRVKVIDGYGQRPSPARAMARTALYFPSLLLLALGFLWVGFDREKRGLHDWLADTYVVEAEA